MSQRVVGLEDLFGPDVVDVHHAKACCQPAEARARAGREDALSIEPVAERPRYAACMAGRVPPLPVMLEEDAELSLAEVERKAQDRRHHRIDVTARPADDAQHLGQRLLAAQRLFEAQDRKST